MKNPLMIILPILMSLILFGCSLPVSADPSCTEGTDTAPSTGDLLVDDTEANRISVKLSFENQLSTEALLSFRDFIQNRISLWCSESIELSQPHAGVINGISASGHYDIIGEARITYSSDDVVSIVTELLINQKNAAHPCYLLLAYNYDPSTLEMIPFADFCRIDGELYSVFSSEAEKKIMNLCDGKWPDTWKSFEEEICSQDVFLMQMNAGGEYTYYLAESGIVISIPVPHSLGDYLEVELTADLVEKLYS